MVKNAKTKKKFEQEFIKNKRKEITTSVADTQLKPIVAFDDADTVGCATWAKTMSKNKLV